MLISIKNRSTGIFAWVIVALIVIPFALFGIQSYFTQGENVAVAQVNGEEIFKTQYQNILQQRTDQMAAQFGENFDPAMLEASGIKQQIVNDLVDRRLFQGYVEDNNFQVGNEGITDNIKQQFTIGGSFNMDAYQRFLSSNRITARQYEENQREQLKIQQLSDALRNSVFVTDNQVNNLYRIQAQKRQLDYVELTPEEFAEKVDITDEAVATFYEENKSAFELPEQIKVSYVDLKIEDLIADYEPTEDEVTAAYEQLAAERGEPDTRRASHILIKTSDEVSLEQAREKAQEILDRVNAGEDFAALASEFSQDVGSARAGGDLGIVNKGQMVQPFEEAVFALEQDEVSDLVETDFGVHIVKVTELKKGKRPTFEELADESRELAAKTLASSEFADIQEQLDTALFDQPEDLQGIAQQLELPIKESVWFNAQGAVDQASTDADIANIPAVRNAAFDENVIDAGLASPVIQISEDRVVAVQVKERKDAYTPELDEIRDDVTTRLREQRIDELVTQTGENYLQQLNQQVMNDESWTNWLSENNLTAKNFSGSRQDLEESLLAAGQRIFSMAPPAQDAFTVTGEKLADGRYMILLLKSIEQPDVQDSSEQAQTMRAQIKQSLTREKTIQSLSGFTQALRDEASIYINSEEL